MIIPVILAAGESRRMGRPKALLPIYQTTFLGHMTGVLHGLGFPTIKIVLGHEAEDIRRQAGLAAADVVVNTNYHQGQLSSLQAAIRHLIDMAYPASGLLVCLVDHPLIDAETVRRMMRAFETGERPIVIPTYQSRRGHPVIFARALFPELLAISSDQSAKTVVRKSSERVLEVETDNDAILVDVDTPEKYEALCRRLDVG